MIAQIPRLGSQAILAGPGKPTVITALAGISGPSDYDNQVEKIHALIEMEGGPDIIGDLSIFRHHTPLWKLIVESGYASATLPVYTARRINNRIDSKELLDIAIEQMEGGVGILTIHPTASLELIDAAKSRIVPWTSRGGSLVIKDLLASNKTENVYAEILPDLVLAAKQYGSVLSIGATFRSANIFDSLDSVQRAEIDAQLRLAREISLAGVGVIIESPGHARPRDILACAEQLSASSFPIMPLGPIPTDIAIGWDHIAAAIGASIMGMAGAAHLLAAVTREEHTGNIPTLESTLEAVRAARIAGHIIDIHTLNATDQDMQLVEYRAQYQTCVVGRDSHGCSRCAATCPLTRDGLDTQQIIASEH
jgi:phosphomethylpyrimidine synthase